MASPEDQQTMEVSAIREAFTGRCRIIQGAGKFTHIVTIQPEEMDVTLKFQLSDSYPAIIPEISIRSESLTEEQREDLANHLKDHAKQFLGQPMIQKLVKNSESWLHIHHIHPGKTTNVNAEVMLKSGKTRPKKQRSKKKKIDEDGEESKKSSMKTATDVIKRILWDEKLDKDDFLVGYLDRFRGLVEKYFSAFSWEDIASVDYDVLAVPKHRIQYFKYRSQKIWEKATRMDNVFGSTGSGVTVYDIIRDYQEPPMTDGGRDILPQSNSDTVKDEEVVDSCSDSDSDDDITVTISSSVNIVSGICERETTNDNREFEDSRYDPFWQDKMRPNYFLALRITNPDIQQGVEQIQDYLLENEPMYGPCCVPPQALHITLCTLGLDTPEQVNHAKEVLKQIQPELISARPSQFLKLEGISNFYNRVIYAKISHNQDFMEFVNHVKLLLIEAGLEIRDSHDFVPHMTIMKVTRPVARQARTKAVDPWLLSNFTDMQFGQQCLDILYLCSMGAERREDGFYMCPAEIHLT